MDAIRKIIQSKLNEIPDVSCGAPIPDGMIEEGTTYFGYELEEVHQGGDLDANYTMEIHLTGRLVRQENKEVNTLEIMDNALEEIKAKLKSLNFKYSYRDVSFQDGIRKYQVNANVRYNQLNKYFIK